MSLACDKSSSTLHLSPHHARQLSDDVVLPNPRSPLLTSAPKTSRRIGGWEAFFTLLKGNWGIGMMAIPYMLQEGGVASSFILFCVSMALTQISIMKLIEVKKLLQKEVAASAPAFRLEPDPRAAGRDAEGNAFDYPNLMKWAVGRPMEWATLVSIVLSMWGSCVAYLKFIKDNMTTFVTPHMDELSSEFMWISIALVPVLGLACLDNLDFLAPVGVVGIAIGIGFVGVLMGDTIAAVQPDDVIDYFSNYSSFAFPNAPLVVSISAFCNEGVVILSVDLHTTADRPNRVALYSFFCLLVFTMLYVLVGVLGCLHAYKLSGGDVKGDISENLRPSSIPDTVAVVLFAVQLIPTFGVVYYCGYSCCETLWCRAYGFPREGNAWEIFYRKRAIGCRWVGILSAAVMAMIHVDFAEFLALVGAMATSLTVYIIPHWAWLKLFWHRVGWCSRAGSITALVLGVAIAGVGTGKTIYDLAT